jgi:hypothetical protein
MGHGDPADLLLTKPQVHDVNDKDLIRAIARRWALAA